MLVNLTETSLVDELLDGFPGWVSKSDVRLDLSDQVGSGLVDSDEGSVVELSKSKESEDSDGSGVKFVDTSDSDDECELGISWDVDLSSKLCVSSGIVFSLLGSSVISVVLLGSLGDLLSSGFVGNFSFFSLLFEGISDLVVSFLTLS